MVNQFQLKNGLKVFLIESHKSPVVSLQAWVRTGSADESPKEAGLSHFIEHLLFKGTRKFKVGEIAQIIEGSGGELNAYTSFDQTVFYMTLSNQFTDQGLEALSEMMGYPAFDQAEIDAEREVVIEEMRRGHDSLGRRASQLLFSTAYAGHPYGRPVIGFEKNIKTVKTKVIKDYFDSRYVPKNMFLVITGAFEKPEMKKMIEKHFGAMESKKFRVVKRSGVKATKKSQVKTEKGNFENSLAYLGWPIPSIQHKDTPALDLLAFVLGSGESSRLVQKLRIEQALVQSVGASTFSPTQDGLFLISFSYNQADPKKILGIISDEIMKVLGGDVQADEIQRAVTAIQSSELYSLETVDGLAQKYGNLEFYYKDMRMTEKYLKQLRDLKASDVIAVAKKYLMPDKTIAVAMTKESPSEAKKLMSDFIKTYSKEFKTQVKKKPSPKLAKKITHAKVPKLVIGKNIPEIEFVDLPNGSRLLLRETRDTSAFSVRVAALGGVRLEPQGKAGLSEMISRVWIGGTEKRDEKTLAVEIESIAAGISPLSGRNSVSLGLDALENFQAKGQDLFLDCLLNPSFPSSVFERERGVLLKQIQSRKDNPAQICIQRFMEKMFAGHPYSRDPMGNPDELMNMNSSELKKWWKDTFLHGKKSIFIGGAFDKKDWVSKFKEVFKELGSPTLNKEKFALHYPKSEVRTYEKAEKEQSHLVVGYPGLNFGDSDRYALHLIQAILAGQGGRLFLELRDKNSLAYSVSPLRMEGLEGGYFGAYIGCAPGKVAQAEKMMHEEFDKLCNVLVPAEELARAQRYTIGRNDIDLQRTSSVASSVIFNEVYGLDPNEAFKCADKYWAVTSQDLQRIARKIFSQAPVKSLVGPNDF